jgi:integrase
MGPASVSSGSPSACTRETTDQNDGEGLWPATLMLELRESPKIVQTMLGHSSVAITFNIYSHVSLELEKRAESRLNAALTGRK